MSAARKFAAFVAATAVLGASGAPQGFLASPEYVSQELVAEQLRSMLGHGRNQARLEELEEVLRSTYRALPKNSRGGLEHRAARYALHRYFLVQHGWHIKGLSVDVTEDTVASPAGMLRSRMPAFIMDTLERQVGGDNLGLEQLAVLAATIEDLVHGDAVDLAERAYGIHGLSPERPLDAEEADLVIRTFALFFVLPSAQGLLLPRVLKLLNGDAVRYYPGWQDTVIWLNDVRRGLEYQDRLSARPFATFAGHKFDFTFMAQWATQISAEFGHFSNIECKEMRNKLFDLEDEERDDGRVQLAKFYGPYLSGGSFHFSESPEYLKHLGALDEHNPRQPSVIVPNIIYAKSNCMATSGFHAVCCIDACEQLLTQLEMQAPEPTASPEALVRIVSSMSSETVAAPRNLSAPLQTRLGEIAARHAGKVPLHGRLFAQWMHYAFPNECPYPRSLLTSEAQLAAKEWHQRQNRTATATKEEMHTVVTLANSSDAQDLTDGPVMLWSEDEAVLGELYAAPTLGQRLRSGMRWVAALSMLIASLFALQRAARAGQQDASAKAGKAGSQPWFGQAASTHCQSHFV